MNHIGTSSNLDSDKVIGVTGERMGMLTVQLKLAKGIALLIVSMATILILLSPVVQAATLAAQAPAPDVEDVMMVGHGSYLPTDSSALQAINSNTSGLADETRAIWSISWTATARAYSLNTDSTGAELLVDRKATMSGFAIRREYIDRPWEKFNLPFSMSLTHEFDRVNRRYCANGGEERNEEHTWVTDPGRYSSGPDKTPAMNRYQRANGTWYIPDPFLAGGGFNFCAGPQCEFREFNTHRIYSWTVCSGHKNDVVTDTEGYQSIFGTPGDIDAVDYEGTTFTKRTEWVVPGSTPTTITWDVTIRYLGDLDLTVEHLEVTQGIQDTANTIPLVQGRRTVVRAYLGIGADPGPIHGVSGVLRAYNGGVLLGEVKPFNRDGVISAYDMPDWMDIDDTLNFELPHAWTLNEALRLEVEVNPGHGIGETSYNNNKDSVDVSFRDCSPLSIAYEPIHYDPAGGPPSDPGAGIAVGHQFLRKVYPVADDELEYKPWPGITWSEIMHTGPAADVYQASGNLAKRLSDDYLFGLFGSDATTYPHRLIGWLAASAASRLNGQANGIPGVAAWVAEKRNPDYWRATFAHEIGHTYGIRHNSLTTNGRHWFDVYDRVIKDFAGGTAGAELYDFIHTPGLVESKRWVSAESYEHLVDQLCPAPSMSVAASQMMAVPIQAQATTTNTLLVTGFISTTVPAGGILDPLFQMADGNPLIPPAGGEYCLKLKSGVTPLSTYCFDGDLEIESTEPITPTGFPFGLAVPLPLGMNRVELTRGTTTLMSARVASAHPPTVTVNFPPRAGLTLQLPELVQWSGADADGDPLTYSVLYSADGGTNWISVGSGIQGGAGYLVDFSRLPGSSQAIIKVMASDGFYSAEDISDYVFTVPNKPPTAVIISPLTMAQLTDIVPVVLEGRGVDLEDGSLGDGALQWSSDRDGALGSGRLLEKMLSPGSHAITLTVTDSDGLTATDEISLTILSTPSWGSNKIYLPVLLRN